MLDVFQTLNTDDVDEYKLKALVQQFNLSGSMLAERSL